MHSPGYGSINQKVLTGLQQIMAVSLVKELPPLPPSSPLRRSPRLLQRGLDVTANPAVSKEQDAVSRGVKRPASNSQQSSPLPKNPRVMRANVGVAQAAIRMARVVVGKSEPVETREEVLRQRVYNLRDTFTDVDTQKTKRFQGDENREEQGADRVLPSEVNPSQASVNIPQTTTAGVGCGYSLAKMKNDQQYSQSFEVLADALVELSHPHGLWTGQIRARLDGNTLHSSSMQGADRVLPSEVNPSHVAGTLPSMYSNNEKTWKPKRPTPGVESATVTSAPIAAPPASKIVSANEDAATSTTSKIAYVTGITRTPTTAAPTEADAIHKKGVILDFSQQRSGSAVQALAKARGNSAPSTPER